MKRFILTEVIGREISTPVVFVTKQEAMLEMLERFIEVSDIKDLIKDRIEKQTGMIDEEGLYFSFEDGCAYCDTKNHDHADWKIDEVEIPNAANTDSDKPYMLSYTSDTGYAMTFSYEMQDLIGELLQIKSPDNGGHSAYDELAETLVNNGEVESVYNDMVFFEYQEDPYEDDRMDFEEGDTYSFPMWVCNAAEKVMETVNEFLDRYNVRAILESRKSGNKE